MYCIINTHIPILIHATVDPRPRPSARQPRHPVPDHHPPQHLLPQDPARPPHTPDETAGPGE